MDSIPPNLYQQIRRALAAQQVFSSDAALRTLFVDARLAAWKDTLPTTTSADSRVRAVIANLYKHYDTANQNALVLLLHVLSEFVNPGDRASYDLAALAANLEAQIQMAKTAVSTPQRPEATGTVRLRYGASEIEVMFGDLFACSGFKAIPVSRHFFETDVAQRSLLHTVLTRFQAQSPTDWREAFHREGERALQDQPYQRAPAGPSVASAAGDSHALRGLLAGQLTENEVQALCFDLGVRYAGLPGAGLAERVATLVNMVTHQGRLLDLVRTGEQLRPDLGWMQAFQGDANIPLTERLYPLGTTARLNVAKESFLLFALTWTELRDHIPEDNCSATKLWVALEKFWAAARQVAWDEDVNIPLLGSGITGINLSPQHLLGLNLLALLNALTERGRITAGIVRVVLYPPAHAEIDPAVVKQLWDTG